MTATVISCLLEYSDVSKKNKMLTFTNNSTTLDDLQLKTCVPCSSGNPSSCSIPTESLVSGGLSTRSPCQRRHSFSLPDGKVCPGLFTDSLKVEPALLACDRDNRDRDNRFRERSYSETGGQAGASRYKTELCRPFEESGACKYGDKCQFAHGAHELRGLSRHPKYKTELCRTFHSAGFCPYGRRCHFIHNAEERRGPPQQPPGRPRLQHSVSFAGFLSGSRSPPPPPAFSAQDLFAWPRPFQDSSQKLLGLGLGPQPSSQPVAPEPPSPSSAPCWTSPSSAPDSLSDQEGYQSSLSGSESPIQDAARRLPIFSSLSISDD